MAGPVYEVGRREAVKTGLLLIYVAACGIYEVAVAVNHRFGVGIPGGINGVDGTCGHGGG